jgi:hypothetical protein
LLLCLSTIGSALATEYTPGVSVGDEFTFETHGYFTTNDPTAVCPSQVLNQNATEWFRVTITNVTDNAVYSTMTTHYKNGTEDISQSYANWSAGQVINFQMLAANLKAGDRLGNLPGVGTINETVTRHYANSDRETNVYDITIVSGDTNDHGIFYFDKQTGIPVEFTDTQVTSGQYTTTTVMTHQIIETNRWDAAIPEFDSLMIPILLLVISAILIIDKKSKTVNRK